MKRRLPIRRPLKEAGVTTQGAHYATLNFDFASPSSELGRRVPFEATMVVAGEIRTRLVEYGAGLSCGNVQQRQAWLLNAVLDQRRSAGRCLANLPVGPCVREHPLPSLLLSWFRLEASSKSSSWMPRVTRTRTCLELCVCFADVA